MRKLLSTTEDLTLTITRLVLGVVFFAHGAQKMLGWFGGYGFHGAMGFFTQQMGIPAPFAFVAICAEFFGGLGLILVFSPAAPRWALSLTCWLPLPRCMPLTVSS